MGNFFNIFSQCSDFKWKVIIFLWKFVKSVSNPKADNCIDYNSEYKPKYNEVSIYLPKEENRTLKLNGEILNKDSKYMF